MTAHSGGAALRRPARAIICAAAAMLVARPAAGVDVDAIAVEGGGQSEAAAFPFVERVDVDVMLHVAGPNEDARPGGVPVFDAAVIGRASDASMRLRFGSATELGDGAVLRLSVIATGEVLVFDDARIAAWGGLTPWLNGGVVLATLDAGPGAEARVHVTSSIVMPRGDRTPQAGAEDGGFPCLDEDRVPWIDPRVGRLLPSVDVEFTDPWCSVWIVSDPERSLLGAGHCAGWLDAEAVVQFNVPPSLPDGTFVHPAPEDQYAIDLTSVQHSVGFGNDWLYAAARPNPDTGLFPYEAQGAFVRLAPDLDDLVDVEGEEIEVLGYGGHAALDERHGALKRDAGPFAGLAGGELAYELRTSGGDSGAPVIRTATGEAIAIHTNNVCASVGASYGTAIDNGALRAAMADPQGLARSMPRLAFDHPDGVPDLAGPHGGDQIQIVVRGLGGDVAREPIDGTLEFVLETRTGVQRLEAVQLDPERYAVQLPSVPGGGEARWSVSIATESEAGYPTRRREHHPFGSGGAAITDTGFRLTLAAPDDLVFAASFDDPAAADAWTIEDGGGLLDGTWQIATPSGGGLRGDPDRDAEPGTARRCLVTADGPGNTDVDGGWTRATSPPIDVRRGGAVLVYDRWLDNRFGDHPGEDEMLVEWSADGGLTWNLLERVDPAGPEAAGGWFQARFSLAEAGVPPTERFRVRFTVFDLGGPSVVEAGIDRVRVFVPPSLQP